MQNTFSNKLITKFMEFRSKLYMKKKHYKGIKKCVIEELEYKDCNNYLS